MQVNTDPAGVWREYQRGRAYKERMGVYANVRRNEAFYIGDQWIGLNAPDLPKPVLNFLKRVVNFSYATVLSDDIAISFTPHESTEGNLVLSKALVRQCERVMENTKARALNRDLLRDAAVDGDCCMYLRFDPAIETGQPAKGDITAETVENINLYFGNPYQGEVQKQPYLILAKRMLTGEVREEALQYAREGQNDLKDGDISAIGPDADQYQGEDEGGEERLTTKLVKFWRKAGTIWCAEYTERHTLRRPFDTAYTLYPFAWMRWEKRKATYHGQSMLTGLIPNQIQTNRLFAMLIRSVEMNAYPRVVYDPDRIAWSSDPTKNLEARGGINAVSDAYSVIRGADVSSQVMEVISSIINLTRDFMGANDAALGNVKPENTSAIIATQQASAIPLELQRLAFYQFVEDYVRIMLDIMRADYGLREIRLEEGVAAVDAQGNIVEGGQAAVGAAPLTRLPFDFSTLDTINYDLNVNIGASSYWSELMQLQTMDNLFAKGLIVDAILYLESVPDKYLPNKEKIIGSLKQQQALLARQAQAALPAQEQAAQPMPTAGLGPMG